MKSTVFAVAAFLAASATAYPAGSCEGPFGELPCHSRNAVNYTIVSGDTLTTIANRFNSGACDIARYNNITDPNKIFPDHWVIVPADCQSEPDKTSCLPPPPIVPTGNDTCVKGLSVDPPEYVVLPGDTFTLIANKFNLTPPALEEPNRDRYNGKFDAIFPFLNKTIIPICQGYSCTNKSHTIASGETFFQVAQANGITVGQIEAANPGQEAEKLQPGQVINVPVCAGIA